MATHQAEDSENEWGIQYPSGWPVYTPEEKEYDLQKEKTQAKLQKEAAQHGIGYICPDKDDGAVQAVDPVLAVDPERHMWVGMAGSAEASLTIEGVKEKADSDTVNEQALLTQWPLIIHMVGGHKSEVAEIQKFMAANYDKNWYEDWLNSNDIIPGQFVRITGDDVKSRHLAVAVSMLYGWLPGKLSCPDCNSTMRLQTQKHYKDYIEWSCNNDSAKAKKEGCKK